MPVTAEAHPAPRGAQLGNGEASAIAATNPAAVPLEGYEEQANNLVRVNTWTASSTPGPAGLQQQAPGRPVLRESRARSSLHFIAGVRRGRSELGDGPSTRPRSRPRHHSPGSASGNNTTISPPTPLRILGCRRRAASPPSGAPERPYHRRRVTFAEDPPKADVFFTSRRGINHTGPALGAVRDGVHTLRKPSHRTDARK